MDAVEAAQSGHPGTAMAMAPVAYCLWQRHLRFDPADPIWPNRDRFVLSAGHASMLLYSVLHLAGVRVTDPTHERHGEFAVPLGDIRRFRQLDSLCPGHPEYRWTSGVETTTGPLGQGLATSVGMAIRAEWLAASFDRPDFEMFGHAVYAICGDGCMMEGVSAEATSLAGHLKLANLCWIYDDNKITIEGQTELAFSEDVAARFVSYGWKVSRVRDANDLECLDRAFDDFREERTCPTLIIVDSHIAYGAPNRQDTSAAHGAPLGEEEIRLANRNYDWPEDAQFRVSDDVRAHFDAGVGTRGSALRAQWCERFEHYRQRHPDSADSFETLLRGELPNGWDRHLAAYPPDEKGLAGRAASGEVLNAIARQIPWLLGGSADLAPSTLTRLKFEGAGDFSGRERAGRNLHFGVREHAMSAALNGLALEKIRVFGSGFLIFSDYVKSAIRLSALMEIPVIHIFTHDSIGVGEDGPTHQPIEQLAALRSIPSLVTLSPSDANEIVAAWRFILQQRHEPVALILARQVVPTLDRARVISMPSWELFERQSIEYRANVFPPEVRARVSVEAASTLGWTRYVGSEGCTIGMETFGASAPLAELKTKFGFTAARVAEAARAQIDRHVGCEEIADLD